MRSNRYLWYSAIAILLAASFIGCPPRIDTMAKAEKIFIKMVDKTSKKLDLNEGQKIQLEGLKTDIQENFREGQKERNEALMKIKEEGKREKPEGEQYSISWAIASLPRTGNRFRERTRAPHIPSPWSRARLP